MSQTNACKINFAITGVDLKTVANTPFFGAFTGKKFVPRALFARIATRTGTGAFSASITVSNGGAVNLCYFPSGMPDAKANDIVELALNGSARMLGFDVGTTGISLSVTGASPYTTHTADFGWKGISSDGRCRHYLGAP
jgi:hypothetical protein